MFSEITLMATKAYGIPTYRDWNFWIALLALISFIVSVFPKMSKFFKKKIFEIEAHTHIGITHKFGNPNINIYIDIKNAGGIDVKVKDIKLKVYRDGNFIQDLVGWSYALGSGQEKDSLLVPFILKSGDDWAGFLRFVGILTRNEHREINEQRAALRNDILEKRERNKTEGREDDIAIADQILVRPFLERLENKYIWGPGEYEIVLDINSSPNVRLINKKFRFIIYESDDQEMRSDAEGYSSGEGVYFDLPDRHNGVFLDLQPSGE